MNTEENEFITKHYVEEMTTDIKKCDVCQKTYPIDKLQVYASSLGAISFCYCKEFATHGAEPDGYQDLYGPYLTYRDGKYQTI